MRQDSSEPTHWRRDLRSKILDGLLPALVLYLLLMLILFGLKPIQAFFGGPGLLVYVIGLLGVAMFSLQRSLMTSMSESARAWYGMAAIQNGGLALNKTREWLGLQWPDFFAAALSCPTGAGGVSVIPYLAGERGGVAQPATRGAWLGLSDSTTPAHLARAAIEGMLFTVRQGVELLAGPQQQVRVSGGGVREPFVAQLLADVLRATISVVPERSASALGAAMLAATGVGQTIAVAPGQPSVFEPRQDAHVESAYQRWVERLPAGDI